jgi:two-component system, LytTR family, sensor kinase
MERTRTSFERTRLALAAGWVAVVLVFASQWYAYDAGHGVADRFADYLGWSCYMWGVLTPLALWLAHRWPIESRGWKRSVPLHVAASVLLTVVQLSLEASVEWLRTGAHRPLAAELRHYLTEHTQISLLTYWALVGAAQFYRAHEQGRARRLQAAQLEARLAEAHLESLRAQLQPHFLFNTLQAAATLIYDDPEGAEDILQHLGQLLRASFDELHVQEVPLRREMELLQHYVNIQQRRFGKRLRFDLRIDPRALDCAVPTLVLQPLAENAVRHGVGKHKEDDVVTVEAFRHQDALCLKISNLTSALDDRPERLFSRGVGLSNTRRRLRQLYGQGQELDIFDVAPRGVCVRLFIPAHETARAEEVAAELAIP